MQPRSWMQTTTNNNPHNLLLILLIFFVITISSVFSNQSKHNQTKLGYKHLMAMPQRRDKTPSNSTSRASLGQPRTLKEAGRWNVGTQAEGSEAPLCQNF